MLSMYIFYEYEFSFFHFPLYLPYTTPSDSVQSAIHLFNQLDPNPAPLTSQPSSHPSIHPFMHPSIQPASQPSIHTMPCHTLFMAL